MNYNAVVAKASHRIFVRMGNQAAYNDIRGELNDSFGIELLPVSELTDVHAFGTHERRHLKVVKREKD